MTAILGALDQQFNDLSRKVLCESERTQERKHQVVEVPTRFGEHSYEAEVIEVRVHEPLFGVDLVQETREVLRDDVVVGGELLLVLAGCLFCSLRLVHHLDGCTALASLAFHDFLAQHFFLFIRGGLVLEER